MGLALFIRVWYRMSLVGSGMNQSGKPCTINLAALQAVSPQVVAWGQCAMDASLNRHKPLSPKP